MCGHSLLTTGGDNNALTYALAMSLGLSYLSLVNFQAMGKLSAVTGRFSISSCASSVMTDNR